METNTFAFLYAENELKFDFAIKQNNYKAIM